MTKDVISLSISVLLLFRHYISHKITFGAPSSGGVLCSACGAFIRILALESYCQNIDDWTQATYRSVLESIPKRLHKSPCGCRILKNDLIL